MRSLRFSGFLFAILFGVQAAALLAGEWPQYRGPEQNGISHEKINLNWSASEPKEIWRVPTNLGFSSFAVSGGKVFTEVVRDMNGQPREVCLALDAATGKELWTANVADGNYPGGAGEGDGPRNTPTFSDGKVYIYTANMVLWCLDAGTGKTVWSHDIIKEHAGRNIRWNSASSPVVDGKLVFVAGGGAGQSVLAFDKKTGAVAWKGFDQKITHATPVVATILGQRQIIFFMQKGLFSVSTEGKALWTFPFPYNVSTAISPVVSGDIVYCSAGYDVGSGACRIEKNGDGFKAVELWKIPGNNPVCNHWSTPCVKDGYLYGMFSFKQFKTGPMKCVELATGKVKWEKKGFGPGNIILVNDKILALSDQGELVLVEAKPDSYEEVSRMKAIKGKCWSTPALSDGRIYVRSSEEGVCLDVRK